MATKDKVQNISKWGIQQALTTPPGGGLTMGPNGSDRRRWQMFGLARYRSGGLAVGVLAGR